MSEKSTRSTADERRTALVEAALGAFAKTGLHGTAVSTITDAVGITQPYAFSLFRSKKGLYLATIDHCLDRLEAHFRAVAERTPRDERLAALGHSFVELIESEPAILHLILQSFADSDDEEVRVVTSRRLVRVLDLVKELTGTDDAGARAFLGNGMLCMLSSALRLDTLIPD